MLINLGITRGVQGGVLEVASFCNNWQTHLNSKRYATDTTADACLNSAVHYIKGLLQELPFEILWVSQANMSRGSKM